MTVSVLPEFLDDHFNSIATGAVLQAYLRVAEKLILKNLHIFIFVVENKVAM